MISVKSHFLLRLMPRVFYNGHATGIVGLNTSILQSSQAIHMCCMSTANRPILLPLNKVLNNVNGSPCGFPKRSLAGAHKDDYILDQNSLTEAEKQEIEASVKEDFEDWIPHGYNPADKEDDIFRHKMFLFSSITLGFVVFMYFLVHIPPPNKREWVTREAYLELERRQRLGLPLVDRNLIPEDQILLPTEEELGDDYEIII
ncbi:hypothetical protein BOX15_Mlig029159g1 [Macrostomum lignano]|uniref:NADH dehydrogenase [ubiquinone] 1 beta subcomplex subunit 11, mitochondrial n=1 Tax=Macrostomum lignano TaxID=282301 RepID=A0A267FWM7_9PLAT|nr:hypothetical protein BOX15_Mlig029159g3 [Macrostomum lignano]PAA88541.1 hypothetical protein BOX15_Mlig029159g1 [Macrostomum lignano]